MSETKTISQHAEANLVTLANAVGALVFSILTEAGVEIGASVVAESLLVVNIAARLFQRHLEKKRVNV